MWPVGLLRTSLLVQVLFLEKKYVELIPLKRIHSFRLLVVAPSLVKFNRFFFFLTSSGSVLRLCLRSSCNISTDMICLHPKQHQLHRSCYFIYSLTQRKTYLIIIIALWFGWLTQGIAFPRPRTSQWCRLVWSSPRCRNINQPSEKDTFVTEL